VGGLATTEVLLDEAEECDGRNVVGDQAKPNPAAARLSFFRRGAFFSAARPGLPGSGPPR
jgi:hypothetical protein